ncbi:MAG: tetratricopeptide repeat protein [Candidatus Obscuribacterales bacterium]|nr:tetratricopeptide repeat protein [Candidatus Obscuribacterales bacterium]
MHIYRRRHSVATTLLALAISMSGCSMLPSVDNSIASGHRALSDGQFDRAEQHFQQAIGDAEKAGKKTPQVAVAKVGLADTYVEEEIYDDAETLYEDALDIDSAEMGQTSEKAFHGLGKLNLKRQTFALSEKYLTKALKIQKDLGETNTVETAKVLNDLGDLYQLKGKSTLAKQNFEESLNILEDLDAKEYKLQTKLMENLATIAADEEDIDAAQDYKTRITQLQLSHAKNVMSILPWVNNKNAKDSDESDDDSQDSQPEKQAAESQQTTESNNQETDK